MVEQDPCGSRPLLRVTQQIFMRRLLSCLLRVQLLAVPKAHSRGLVEAGHDFRSDDLREGAHREARCGRGWAGRLA